MEEEEVEVPVTKESAKGATKMDTDDAPLEAAHSVSAETDVNMQDAKGDADVPSSENPAQAEDKPAEMETDAKVSSCKFIKLYRICA